MSQYQALRAATSLHDVAKLLGFKPSAVAYILYKKPDPNKYTSFDVAKRGGGLRQIKAPTSELKKLQRNLSTLLQNCVGEINVKRRFGDQLAHGFKRERSIVTNAARHCRRGYVFNIDLENFFGTINFGRVRGFFIKDANFMLAPRVATVLAQIACHDNALPQGSPCSPVISNLVGHILDIHLSRLAATEGCVYSRYADDITFSTSKPVFPSAIAMPLVGGTHQWEAGSGLSKIVTRAGFTINPGKSRMQYSGSRQAVTGLVVNRKVNIRSEYRRTVRAMAQNLFMTGRFDFVATTVDPKGASVAAKVSGSVDQLNGMLAHIDFIDRHNEKVESLFDSGSQNAQRLAKGHLESKQTLYRRFLIFKDFYSATRPVVLCEGKTDNIYLLNAIKSLAGSYPRLASVSPNKKAKVTVRILRTQGRSIGRILHLGYGAGSLKGFVERYVGEMARFKAPGMEHPVILLLDNDTGGESVLKAIKGITKKVVSKTDAYSHIVGNLYVVLTPLKPGETEAEIEDMFDDSIKDLVLGGKVFNRDEKADSSLYFSKAILAQYVRENAAKIDFTGFASMLDAITKVIEEHQANIVHRAKMPVAVATTP